MAQADPLSPIPAHLGKPLQTWKSSGSILPRLQLGFLGLFCLFIMGLCFIPGVARAVPIYFAMLPLLIAAVFGYFTFRKGPEVGWTVTVCENGVASRDIRNALNPDALQNLD